MSEWRLEVGSWRLEVGEWRAENGLTCGQKMLKQYMENGVSQGDTPKTNTVQISNWNGAFRRENPAKAFTPDLN